MKEIMTKREVAELLGFSQRFIQKLIAEKKLSAHRLGGRKSLRIRKEAVERYLRQTQI